MPLCRDNERMVWRYRAAQPVTGKYNRRARIDGRQDVANRRTREAHPPDRRSADLPGVVLRWFNSTEIRFRLCSLFDAQRCRPGCWLSCRPGLPRAKPTSRPARATGAQGERNRWPKGEWQRAPSRLTCLDRRFWSGGVDSDTSAFTKSWSMRLGSTENHPTAVPKGKSRETSRCNSGPLRLKA